MTLKEAVNHALDKAVGDVVFLYNILNFLKPDEENQIATLSYVIEFIQQSDSPIAGIDLDKVRLYSLYSDIADSVTELGYETEVTWDIENEKLFAGGFQIESLKDFKSVMGV